MDPIAPGIEYAPITPASIMGKAAHGEFREAAKDLHRAGLMRFAREGADLVVTYSAFVQGVAQMFDMQR